MASAVSLFEWDTDAVQNWFVKLGYGRYEDAIQEHGITGDVLALLDHATLEEMGVGSVGHRLGVLKAVWEVKRAQGIPIAAEDWKPSDEQHEEKPFMQDRSGMERLWALVAEQHERIHMLETQHIQLQHLLEDQGLAAIPSTPIQPGHIPPDLVRVAESSPSLKRAGSLNVKWREFAEDNERVASGSTTKASRRSSSILPGSMKKLSNGPVPHTGLSDHFNDSFTPTTNTPLYPFESPSGPQQPIKRMQPPPLVRLMSNSSLLGAPGALQSPSPTSQILNNQQTESSPHVASHHPASEERRERTNKSVEKAAKSFKVTLEDPTFKVLPAALKKYKRGEDWRQYAMFICYGEVVRTERCLAYDEKPLLLFQKLKESGQNPVFMLRHIREIKSPIAVAQQKHASKKSKAMENKLATAINPHLSFSAEEAASPTTSTHPYGSGNTRLHHPPVLQPVSAKAQQAQKSAQPGFPDPLSPGVKEGETQGQMSVAAMLKLLDGNDNKPLSYAIAIYPYYADREDEFDVEVGATFIILAKDKTWWIVQKDTDGTGLVKPDVTKSGWVPSGCLLETKEPITTVVANSPTAASHPDPNAPAGPPKTSRQPILPTAIVSSSYPGIALMDYDARSEDELQMVKNEELRVFKKYNHWSYCVKTATGQRGWVPAWFIGKQATDGATGSGTPVIGSHSGDKDHGGEPSLAREGSNQI